MKYCEEAFFGCECTSLDHVVHFSYFKPLDDDNWENEIYFTVKSVNYLNRIFPPFSFNPTYWIDNFKSYFRYHIFKRFKIALSYIFNPYYIREHGILDCFNFQEKDLIPIRRFLSHLTKDENCENLKTIVYLENRECQLRFIIGKLDEGFPYEIGHEIQFLPEQLFFSRIRYGLKYIFGRYNDEQHFEIDISAARNLKGMITVVKLENSKDETTT